MRSSDISTLHYCRSCDARFRGRWLHEDAAVAMVFRGYWRIVAIHELRCFGFLRGIAIRRGAGVDGTRRGMGALAYVSMTKGMRP